MTKIWVIEQGSYSDYRVVGVFSSKENAERVLAFLKKEDDVFDVPEIAEWVLDPHVTELNAGLKPFLVTMSMNGTVEQCKECVSSYALSDSLRVWERTKADYWKGRSIADAVMGSVWAEDAPHAIKIANEFRAQAIAMGKMASREVVP